jgi:hypothetical protein
MKKEYLLNEGAIFARALSDFFSARFLMATIAPFLVTMVLAFGFLYFLSGEFFSMLSAVAQSSHEAGAAQSSNELVQFAAEYPIISAILGSVVFKAVAGALFYLVGAVWRCSFR